MWRIGEKKNKKLHFFSSERERNTALYLSRRCNRRLPPPCSGFTSYNFSGWGAPFFSGESDPHNYYSKTIFQVLRKNPTSYFLSYTFQFRGLNILSGSFAIQILIQVVQGPYLTFSQNISGTWFNYLVSLHRDNNDNSIIFLICYTAFKWHAIKDYLKMHLFVIENFFYF